MKYVLYQVNNEEYCYAGPFITTDRANAYVKVNYPGSARIVSYADNEAAIADKMFRQQCLNNDFAQGLISNRTRMRGLASI